MLPTTASTAARLSNPYDVTSDCERDVHPADLVRDAAAAFVTMPPNLRSSRGSPLRNGTAPGELLRYPTVRDQNATPQPAPDVVQFPPPPDPPATLHALQEWEGYVLESSTTDFTARLLDLTKGALHEREEAVIPLDELADHEVKKVRPGAIFRWVIGYERAPLKPLKRVSVIVFRDLPVVTKSDQQAGDTWARDIQQAFGP